MTPCYQICKDRNCFHWNPELFDCERLPDDCDYAVEHLVEDREKQWLDGEEHGLWRGRYKNGNRWFECAYVNGKEHGRSRWWYRNGQLQFDGNFVNGERDGRCRNWYKNGELLFDEVYKNGVNQ